jgi:hypothetical protein
MPTLTEANNLAEGIYVGHSHVESVRGHLFYAHQDDECLILTRAEAKALAIALTAALLETESSPS